MSQHRTRRQCTEHTHTQTHKQTETIGVDCSQLAGEQRALFVCVCLYITIDCQFDLILTKRDSRHQLAKWAAAATVLDDYPVHGHEFTARRHQFEVSHRVSVSVWLIDDRGAAERRRRRREREPVVVPGPEGKSSAASEASWASIGFPLITTRYPLSLSFSTLHCTCLLLDTGCIFPFPPSFREKKTESLLPVQSWMTTIGKGGGGGREEMLRFGNDYCCCCCCCLLQEKKSLAWGRFFFLFFLSNPPFSCLWVSAAAEEVGFVPSGERSSYLCHWLASHSIDPSPIAYLIWR